MIRHPRPRTGRCAVSVVLGVLLLCSVARAEARSIQEFLNFKDKWNDFVITGYVWQLEGRYGLISDGTLTFSNCSLPFRITTEQANSRGSTGVVEVTGKIVQEEKGLAFQVETLAPRPRDLERLRTLRFGINSDHPEEWYKVADWARGRGFFYNDKELLQEAVGLDREGVLAELRQLRPDDETKFADLLRKAREKKLDDSLLQQMTHDSLQARLITLRSRKFADQDFLDLQARIQQELPGAGTSLPQWPAPLADQYAQTSKETFTAADGPTRLQLARIFFVNVLLERILQAARPDGSNGFEVADRLRREVPERAELAEKYEELGTTWRFAKLGISTRTQLLELTDRLQRRGREEQARQAKVQWLKSREPLFRQDGARGLDDLAQQWMSLLKDEQQAAQLYVDAWRENRQYSPATDWLTAHGYQQVGDTWLTATEVAQMPLSPLELAIRDGRVEAGMTARQVQAALGSVPSSITRLASRKQVTEWWVYKDAGVVVELSKPSRARESSVVKVEKLPAP